MISIFIEKLFEYEIKVKKFKKILGSFLVNLGLLRLSYKKINNKIKLKLSKSGKINNLNKCCILKRN